MFTLASLPWHLAVIVIEFMGTAANSGHKWWAMSQVEPSTKATTSSGCNKSQWELQGLRIFSHEAPGSRSEPTWPQRMLHKPYPSLVEGVVSGHSPCVPGQEVWVKPWPSKRGGILYFHFHFRATQQVNMENQQNCIVDVTKKEGG